MGKTVKFSNAQGGVTPYEYELIPIGVQSSDAFNDVPTGIFRAKVLDDAEKTTLPKNVTVVDPTHVTDRAINWNKIAPFSLPAGIEAVAGWGFPRWLDEAQPTDALNHGWTHTDNNIIDGVELVNAKRVKTIYFPTGGFSAYFTALNEIKAAHPSIVQGAIIQEFTIVNTTNSVLNFTYINYLNVGTNDSVPADEFGEDPITVECLFGTQPNVVGGGNINQGIIRIKNPDGVTDAAWVALGRAYYNQEKWIADGATVNPVGHKMGVLFYNEETLGNATRSNQLIFKSLSLESVAQGSPIKIIYYGKYFTHWGGGFYSGQQNDAVGWKLKVFPNLSTGLRATAETLNEYADRVELGEANCVYLNGGTYFKVPYPQTNTKYEKQNGNYVLDQDGERKYRIGDFSETIRGTNVTFLNDTQVGGWVGADPAYGYPNNRVSEMFWAIWQFYSMASQMIFLNLAIAKKYRGNADIYTQFDDLPVKNCAVIRDETEPTAPAYANIPRPLTTFQIEHGVLQTLALCENYTCWTDYGVVRHPNEGVPFAARNKGTGYANGNNPTGNNFQQFSQFEDMTWALKNIADAHAKGGVFGVGNKKIVAYQPADTTHEILIFGRIKSNKLWVFAAEPRLDPNETMLVTITNKKNNYSQKFNVKGGENFVDLFALPATDSYEPADIVFSYNDIYGVAHKVSGDLRQHFVGGTPIDPPQDGSSIFEFFSPTNGQPYPVGNQGNGYMLFQFAGWSIISSNPAVTPINIAAHVKCELFDADDNLVCKIIDNRANFHPSFAPFFPSGQDLRSNNHLPQFAKYLPFGDYRIRIENTSDSTVTMKLRLGWQGIGGTGMELLNDEPLAKGGVRNLDFTVGNTWTDGGGTVHNFNDGSNAMTLNFNVYTYP